MGQFSHRFVELVWHGDQLEFALGADQPRNGSSATVQCAGLLSRRIIPPDPVGEWDYRGYDSQGTLVLTGKLSIASRSLLASNPPIYSFSGWREIRYAGPPTNHLGYLVTQIGTGGCSGRLEVNYASLSLEWPTNCVDCASGLGGTLWPNAYTGSWYYATWAGPFPGGPFSAERR